MSAADGFAGLNKPRIRPNEKIDRVDKQPYPFKDAVPETGEDNDRSVRSSDGDLLEAVRIMITKMDILIHHLQIITDEEITKDDLGDIEE